MAVWCRRLCWTLLLWLQIGYGLAKISDLRVCGDPECNEPVSEGRTLIKYTSNDPQILSFGINVPVKIFSKSAGKKADLWGGEINGKRAYFPMRFVKETRIFKRKLEFTVPTEGSSSGVGQGSLSGGLSSEASVALPKLVERAELSRRDNEAPMTTQPSNLDVQVGHLESVVLANPTGIREAEAVTHPAGIREAEAVTHPTGIREAEAVTHPTGIREAEAVTHPTGIREAEAVTHPTGIREAEAVTHPTGIREAEAVTHPTGIREAEAVTHPTGIREAEAVTHPTGIREAEAVTHPTGIREAEAVTHPTGIREAEAVTHPTGKGDELTANVVAAPTITNLPTESIAPLENKALPIEEPSPSTLHDALKNVWETVKDSKVLALPWESIQTVATFGNNFPKSLNQLSDSLIQRIGASANAVDNVASATGGKPADSRYEVYEGTTLWNGDAVDDSGVSPHAEDEHLPTKQQLPDSPTEGKMTQGNEMRTPEPNVHLSSSFSQSLEYKATNTPSLLDKKMESSIDATVLGTATDNNELNISSASLSVSVSSMPLVSSEVLKSVLKDAQQRTLTSVEKSILPTQSVVATSVSDAVVSEQAYLRDTDKAHDISNIEDVTYQPSEYSVPLEASQLPGDESQWASESNQVDIIQPSASADKPEYVEGGSWFSTLKRTLLGTNEQGQEEPSVAEEYTKSAPNSWMGKEGSMGLPRADSGFFSDPPADETEDEDDDDTLADVEDEDDDEDDYADEESDATIEDLIAEDSARAQESTRAEPAETTKNYNDASVELNKNENIPSEYSDKAGQPPSPGHNTVGMDSEGASNDISKGDKEGHKTGVNSQIAGSITPEERKVQLPEVDTVSAKANEPSVTSTVRTERERVSDVLPEISASASVAGETGPLSLPQDVEKSTSNEEVLRRKEKIEVDTTSALPLVKDAVKGDDALPQTPHDIREIVSPLSQKLNEQTKEGEVEFQTKTRSSEEVESVPLPHSIPADANKVDSASSFSPLISPSSLSGVTPSVVDNSQVESSISSSTDAPPSPAPIETIAGEQEPLWKYDEQAESKQTLISEAQDEINALESKSEDIVPSSEASKQGDLHTPTSGELPNVDEKNRDETTFDPLSLFAQSKPASPEAVSEGTTKTDPVEVDQPEEQSADEATGGFLAFFAELDVSAAGKAYVDWLRPYMQLFVDLLPEPIHASLMEYEEQGFSPRVLVFTVISGGFLAIIIIAYYVVKRGSNEKGLMLKLCNMDKKLFEAVSERDIVKEELTSTKQKTIDLQSNLSEAQEAIELLDSELLAAKTECGKLQATVASLEEQLETATEAGLELNNMLSDFLTSQNEGRKLQESVALLQEQLDLQKNSVSDMQSNAKNKAQQYSALKEEHDDALLKIEDLEMQNKKLRLESDENESNYEHARQQIEMLEEQTIQLQENNKQLLREAEIWNQRVHELQEQVETYGANNKELKDSLATKIGEIEVLKDIIQQLKVMQDDDTDAIGDSEKLQKLMDVSRLTAELNAVSQEKSCIVEHLSVEIEKRKSLEDSLAKTVTEVEQLRESHAVLSQQRDEAYTKLQVLSGYFKEKEIELQRELGVQEVMRQQSQDSVLSVGQRAAVYEQEVLMYKSQIDDLKKEIDSQARSYKSQIAQHESKAHDSWLAARAAERKADEARQEAALLRNKLTLIEQEKESMQGQGDSLMVKPLPKRFTGSNGEVPSPPRLESEPSELPVSGPPSLLREPLDSPRRMPFLPLDRPMPPPALGFPPPFLRDRFPPPPMYDLHGPPFDLPGLPPPPYHPHHRPFDHRMSPPLARRSPPLRRMSPPFDPHSPLPPRDYRSPPPIDRRGPPDRLQSPPPFDRRPPSGRHTSPPHLPRERNYPGPYEREFRERSPPRFHDRGPPPGVLAPGLRQGPPPVRRDQFPDNRLGALTDPRTSSPMTDQLSDSQQPHPTTQV